MGVACADLVARGRGAVLFSRAASDPAAIEAGIGPCSRGNRHDGSFAAAVGSFAFPNNRGELGSCLHPDALPCGYAGDRRSGGSFLEDTIASSVAIQPCVAFVLPDERIFRGDGVSRTVPESFFLFHAVSGLHMDRAVLRPHT